MSDLSPMGKKILSKSSKAPKTTAKTPGKAVKIKADIKPNLEAKVSKKALSKSAGTKIKAHAEGKKDLKKPPAVKTTAHKKSVVNKAVKGPTESKKSSKPVAKSSSKILASGPTKGGSKSPSQAVGSILPGTKKSKKADKVNSPKVAGKVLAAVKAGKTSKVVNAGKGKGQAGAEPVESPLQTDNLGAKKKFKGAAGVMSGKKAETLQLDHLQKSDSQEIPKTGERKKIGKKADIPSVASSSEAKPTVAAKGKTEGKKSARSHAGDSGEELESDTPGREEEEVILTDADGRRYCRVRDCDQAAIVEGYCRYHYLLFWKNIQVRKKILTEGKLERYIEDLTARYPDKFLDILKKDLRSEKDFLVAIQELEIDESSEDGDFEEEDQSFIDEVRGISDAGGREEEEF